MAGESTSSIIIFIAAMLAAAVAAGTLTTAISTLQQPVDAITDDVESSLTTDVEIINDGGADATYDDTDGTVRLYVKNTGSNELQPRAAQLDLLIDGTYVSPSSISLLDSQDARWGPQEVIEITIETTLDTGNHRVTVYANENSDTFNFYVN